MKKKIIGFVLAICLIVPCAIALVACGADDSTAKIMNISLNPKIELVLDKNDKVLTVNALNEDGNHIISESINEETEVSEFEGMTADEAVELFLEITEENGYLVTGNEEEITIEVSGKADKLMKKVKEKANKFFDDNGLDIAIVTDKIEKSDILNEVKECMKEYSETELENMSQEQLIDLLKGSRQETKNLLTQELKDAYYNMRIEKINIAELEELLTIIEGLSGVENSLLTSFATYMETVKEKIEALENAYETYFLSETSDYNVKKQAYITAKQDLLNARLEYGVDGISEAEQTELDALEATVATAKTSLETAKSQAELAIATAREEMNTVLTTIQSSIEGIKTALSALGINLDNLNNAKQNAKNSFKNQFEQHDVFKGHIGNDKGHWGQVGQVNA